MLIPDLAQAQQFLKLLDSTTDSFTFQTFGDTPDAEAKLPPFWRHGSLNDYAGLFIENNNQGAGISVMVNRGDGKGRSAQHVIGVRAAFVDLDGSSPATVLNAKLKPSFFVESSPGRYHAYWLVKDCPLNQFTAVQDALASKFSGDPSVHDLPRVMRVPGFYHHKNDPFLTHIIDAGSPEPITLKVLIEGLGLEFGGQSLPKHVTANSPLVSPALSGDRNNMIFRFACQLRAKGLTYEETEALVLNAASQCIPPLNTTEAISCLKSSWKYGEKPEYLTDLGNAKRLVKLFRKVLRYVPEFRKWICWNGQCWVLDHDGEVQRFAKETVELIFAEAKTVDDAGNTDLSKKLREHALKSQSAGRLSAMVKVAKSEPGTPIPSSQLDAEPMLLGVQNGVLDLKTGQMGKAEPGQYITKLANAAYDPSATCPVWLAFLDQIMDGNKALLQLIQRAIGYSLTGYATEQCLLILYGVGSNGKSTFLNTIRELLGAYAVQSPASALMVKSGSGVPNDIARLRGARFVATSEVEEGQRFGEALVKQLTGGDTITARFLFAEYFEFVPTFTIWLAANHKPVIKGDDHAMWRRIRLIPFSVTISDDKQDKELPNKLRQEFSGILNWAIAGCLQWQAQGLNPPQDVMEATHEYQAEMDVLGQ